MLINTDPISPAYRRLCTQEITIYHKDSDGYKTEYRAGFFDSHKTQSVDRTGSTEVSQFQVVIPGDIDIVPGDKVMLGRGDMIYTREEWADLIPSKVKDLVVVRTVDRKCWHGQITHVEIGG